MKNILTLITTYKTYIYYALIATFVLITVTFAYNKYNQFNQLKIDNKSLELRVKLQANNIQALTFIKDTEIANLQNDLLQLKQNYEKRIVNIKRIKDIEKDIKDKDYTYQNVFNIIKKMGEKR